LSEDLIRAAAASTPITASSRTDDIPPSWDERAVLTTMLDYVRDTVQVKCAGLSDEQARRAPLPGSPLTTISSLVSHLRWVEYYWIRVILLGEQDRTPVTEDDPDAESLGTLSWRNEPVTLRWVLMHLIEETARHNGHIDLLREMADGLTGR